MGAFSIDCTEYKVVVTTSRRSRQDHQQSTNFLSSMGNIAVIIINVVGLIDNKYHCQEQTKKSKQQNKLAKKSHLNAQEKSFS